MPPLNFFNRRAKSPLRARQREAVRAPTRPNKVQTAQIQLPRADARLAGTTPFTRAATMRSAYQLCSAGAKRVGAGCGTAIAS